MNIQNNIKVFNSDRFGEVRAILNSDGSISINAEDAARNFGWIQIKQGRYYIRWETVNSYLSELGISQQVGKNDFIPESFFYLLGMKASNETAQEFQKWLAIEVLPQIRKTGGYRLNEEGLSPEIKAIFCIDNRTVIMENRLESLENNMTIDYSQQEELRTLAVKRVVSILGGKNTPAYRELNKKAFSSMWKDYKRAMNVNSYKNTAVKMLEEARKMIIEWKPDRDLELMIRGANSNY